MSPSALTTTTHDEVAVLDAYFARARSINLLMAHNGGFVDFYAPADGGAAAALIVRRSRSLSAR